MLFYYLRIYFIFNHMYLCLCAYIHMSAGTQRGQRELHPWELKLPMWVLKHELRFYARVICTFFFFFDKSLTMYPWLAWDSLCRQDWPECIELCLPVFAFQVLGLKMNVFMPRQNIYFNPWAISLVLWWCSDTLWSLGEADLPRGRVPGDRTWGL